MKTISQVTPSWCWLSREWRYKDTWSSHSRWNVYNSTPVPTNEQPNNKTNMLTFKNCNNEKCFTVIEDLSNVSNGIEQKLGEFEPKENSNDDRNLERLCFILNQWMYRKIHDERSSIHTVGCNTMMIWQFASHRSNYQTTLASHQSMIHNWHLLATMATPPISWIINDSHHLIVNTI